MRDVEVKDDKFCASCLGDANADVVVGPATGNAVTQAASEVMSVGTWLIIGTAIAGAVYFYVRSGGHKGIRADISSRVASRVARSLRTITARSEASERAAQERLLKLRAAKGK
jgi:hypothetical protein